MLNRFLQKISPYIVDKLCSQEIKTVQLNLGRCCNLECKHCHLSCNPGRQEMMSWKIMKEAIKFIQEVRPALVDLTGGAPELNPELGRLIATLSGQNWGIQVRTNLVVLTLPGQEETISCFRKYGVALVASLPCYLEENVTAQRGDNVYVESIKALRQLNALGYGRDEALVLNLVYNPGGPVLPGAQSELEVTYRKELKSRFELDFTNLVTITNMPIGRFANCLQSAGKLQTYQQLLENSFNPQTLEALMCRSQICLDYDGLFYDCDFNLALELQSQKLKKVKLADAQASDLQKRLIATGNHCFGCTAGQGSSCKGALVWGESEGA